MSTNMTDIRSVPLAALQLSQTPAQKERRAHFDKAKLGELAESLKSVGLLQPIVVRPATVIDVIENDLGRWYLAYRLDAEIGGHNVFGTGHATREEAEDEAAELRAAAGFEVVAGERRVQASKLAGLEEILASVRELDDHQVAKIQLIENLQREDVHPLAEAEGYDELLKKHGYTTEQLAAEVGKSKAYVYARLKLLALDPASREAFYRGGLTASTALLVARIPVASLQRKAGAEIANAGRGEPMSYREAVEYIEHNYMLRLQDAPFPTGDEQLLKNTVACGRCPKRTGNQPELFADIKGADVCTDPTCFKAKREAWSKRLLAEAKSSGQKVITGAEAKKVAPYGEHSLAAGYVKLEDKCYDDPKGRTYKQLLGKDAKPELLQMPKSGDVVEVIQKSLVAKALKDQGVTKPSANGTKSRVDNDKAGAKRERDKQFNRKLFDAVRAKTTKLDRAVLEAAIVDTFDTLDADAMELVEGLWGWKQAVRPETAVTKLSESDLGRLLADCIYAREIDDGLYGRSKDVLLAAAKRLNIDTGKIRKELAAAEKAKSPAPAKPSKKKAKGKTA